MVCRKVDAAHRASKDARAVAHQRELTRPSDALDCMRHASSASGGDVPTRIAVRITTARPNVSSTAALFRSSGIVSGFARRGLMTRQLNAPTSAVIAITTSLRNSACP